MRGKGEGTLWQRKDGLWAGCIQVERKRHTVYGKTRTQAANKLKELRKQLEAGAVLEGGALKVGEFLDKWLESAKASLAYKTRENYEQVVRDHLKPAIGNRPLGKLRPDEVQQLLNRLSDKGLGPRTVQNVRSVLRRALNVAVRWRYIQSNPASTVDLPRLRKKQLKLWSSKEVEKFLAEVKGHRWEPIYWLLIYLGLRKGEVLCLLREDVNLQEQTLTVQATLQRQRNVGLVRKDTKTESAQRELPIPDVVMPILEAHAARQGEAHPGAEYFFTTGAGTPIEPRNFSRHFDKAVERAGLPKMTIHDLRHLAASELIRAKVDVRRVAAILGHSNASTTLKFYAHVFEGGLREAVNRRTQSEGGTEQGKSAAD